MAARRPWAMLAIGGAAAVAPAAAWGQVTTIPSLTVTAGGAYSSSPFLTNGNGNGNGGGNGGGAVSTQLDIRPALTLIDGTDNATLAANYNRADYFSKYGSNSGYGANASASKRLNPRASIGLTVAYDSQILGANNGFITPLTTVVTTPSTGVVDGVTGGTTTPVATTPVATTPVTTTPIDLGMDGDVGLIGLRQRRNLLSAGISGSYSLDTRSSWNAGINAARATYPGRSAGLLLGNSYRNYGGNFGYSRSLTEVSSIGFQVSGSYVDYDAGFKSQVYNPQITYSRTLSERWNLTAAVGAGITHDGGDVARSGNVGRGGGDTNVSVSVNGSLCRSGERTNGCFVASRVPTVSGFGGVRVQTTVGGSFSYRIDPNLSASASANYSRIGASNSDVVESALLEDAQNLFFSDVTVQRRLGRRLSAVGSVSYRRGGGIVGSNAEDVTGRLGLSLAIGGLQ